MVANPVLRVIAAVVAGEVVVGERQASEKLWALVQSHPTIQDTMRQAQREVIDDGMLLDALYEALTQACSSDVDYRRTLITAWENATQPTRDA